jgi:hypothetical protein
VKSHEFDTFGSSFSVWSRKVRTCSEERGAMIEQGLMTLSTNHIRHERMETRIAETGNTDSRNFRKSLLAQNLNI